MQRPLMPIFVQCWWRKKFSFEARKSNSKVFILFSEEFFIQKGIPRLLIARIINVGTVSLHFYMTSPCKNPILAKKVCMIRSMEKLWRGNLANPERLCKNKTRNWSKDLYLYHEVNQEVFFLLRDIYDKTNRSWLVKENVSLLC